MLRVLSGATNRGSSAQESCAREVATSRLDQPILASTAGKFFPCISATEPTATDPTLVPTSRFPIMGSQWLETGHHNSRDYRKSQDEHDRVCQVVDSHNAPFLLK